MSPKGNKFGIHRVITPNGALPQNADKIDNNMDIIYDNEILIDVQSLNIDSASFHQIKESCNADIEKMKARMLEIVDMQGKHRNPVTGSGGMLLGTVEKIGEALDGKIDLKVGDKIATLVSLSLTPLRIDEILKVNMKIDRVDIKGKAILFETGIYAKLPTDFSEAVALAALDVAGAPAQTAKLVKPGQKVLILGATGKSGMMCAYEARKRAGPTGLILGNARNEARAEYLMSYGFCHKAVIANAQNPLEVYEKTLEATGGEEVDLVINCLNVGDSEMSCIMPCKNDGVVYFFSMATSFTKAALGAEGIGKDVTMVIGNGYTKDHAEITLEILRESPKLRKMFEEKYV
ncbi:MAG: L-erythro-3,5-diaminohexanoate dehydrogenase [Promethearchaeota archaeon]